MGQLSHFACVPSQHAYFCMCLKWHTQPFLIFWCEIYLKVIVWRVLKSFWVSLTYWRSSSWRNFTYMYLLVYISWFLLHLLFFNIIAITHMFDQFLLQIWSWRFCQSGLTITCGIEVVLLRSIIKFWGQVCKIKLMFWCKNYLSKIKYN